MAQQIEYFCKNEDFLDKSPDDAWDFLDELAEKYRNWEPSDLGNRSMAAQEPSGSDVLPSSVRDHNDVYHNNQAEVNVINERWDPYSNTYNSGWAQNPLLGWRDQKVPMQPQAPPQQQPQQFRPPQGQMTQFRYPPQNQQGFGPLSFGPPLGINNPMQDKQTDEMMKALTQSQINFTEQTKQVIGDIRTQLTQLTAVVGQVQQEKGIQSSLNPSLEEAKAITTLRSGKVINKNLPPKQKSVPLPVPVAAPAVVPDLGSVPEEKKESESPKVAVSALATPTTPSPPIAPYPHRLMAKPKANVNFQILKLFKKIQFPISLMEAIDAIPQFAKVLKDLCTSKLRTKSQDKVLLMEQLGLGDLRATPVTLQLADRSVRVPKGWWKMF
ncbi:uncharacterized protein LOC131307159 [Rhododendron vialii]|uniref:uncharacterized protein LOC131307159 n=1 Tax=Rhododendron vialii TaxID=182163 RepID=UPI00266027B2|nr:uncharacterized protein LOC131307159 [Rhododendron vialii]